MHLAILKLFVPPILPKILKARKDNYIRWLSRIMVKSVCFLRHEPRAKYYYEAIRARAQGIAEIKEFFPEEKMREHYVYEPPRNTVENPDVYINQLRFFVIHRFLKESYPEIFSEAINVLDVGETSGNLLLSLGKNGVALNINPECVEYMRKRGLEVVLGNAEDMEFEDRSFDYVLCFQCLEHVPNPIKVLNELGRVTKKKVFLSIPNVPFTNIYDVNYWVDAKKTSWKEKEVREVDCHFFEFSTEDFKKILTHTNLECEANFPLKYFDNRTFEGRLLNRAFGSYFNFFVLRPIEKKKVY